MEKRLAQIHVRPQSCDDGESKRRRHLDARCHHGIKFGLESSACPVFLQNNGRHFLLIVMPLLDLDVDIEQFPQPVDDTFAKPTLPQLLSINRAKVVIISPFFFKPATVVTLDVRQRALELLGRWRGDDPVPVSLLVSVVPDL